MSLNWEEFLFFKKTLNWILKSINLDSSFRRLKSPFDQSVWVPSILESAPLPNLYFHSFNIQPSIFLFLPLSQSSFESAAGKWKSVISRGILEISGSMAAHHLRGSFTPSHISHARHKVRVLFSISIKHVYENLGDRVVGQRSWKALGDFRKAFGSPQRSF